MAYVYKHIRLDTEAVFYIGIGSQDNYSRAYTKQNRNRHWHNIVNKAGYSVEIILDGLTWEESCAKEVEYIALYGRKEKGGILCNLTDGGGGSVGLITSEETKKKQSLKKVGKPPPNKGKPMPKHQLEKLVEINRNRVHPKGIPRTPEWIEKFKQTVKGRPSNAKGIKWSEESKKKLSAAMIGRKAWNEGIKMSPEFSEKNKLSQPTKGVLQLDVQGNFIKEFYSLLDAANAMGCSKANIAEAINKKDLKGNRKTAKGYWWEYKRKEPVKQAL